VRPGHLEVVAGATADQRHCCADDAVGAAHDLGLVAGQPVREQQQDAVGAVHGTGDATGRLRAGVTQSCRRGTRGGRLHAEAAAQSGNDDRRVGGSRACNLARSRAADQRAVSGRVAHARKELGQVVSL
jgi:hypothetical protein